MNKNIIESYSELKNVLKEQDIVWYEMREIVGAVDLWAPLWGRSFGRSCKDPHENVMSIINGFRIIDEKSYNTIWRCWRRFPTEEEKENAKWIEPEQKQKVCRCCGRPL